MYPREASFVLVREAKWKDIIEEGKKEERDISENKSSREAKKKILFLNVTPCSLVLIYLRFGRTCYVRIQNGVP